MHACDILLVFLCLVRRYGPTIQYYLKLYIDNFAVDVDIIQSLAEIIYISF